MRGSATGRVHRDRAVEGDRDFDGLAQSVGVARGHRRRGDPHAAGDDRGRRGRPRHRHHVGLHGGCVLGRHHRLDDVGALGKGHRVGERIVVAVLERDRRARMRRGRRHRGLRDGVHHRCGVGPPWLDTKVGASVTPLSARALRVASVGGGGERAVHLVLALCAGLGIGEGGGDGGVGGVADRAALELKEVRRKPDAVVVPVAGLHHIGEHQGRAPRTAAVLGPPVAQGSHPR